MKKLLAIILALSMCFALVACGGPNPGANEDPTPGNTGTPGQTVVETPDPTVKYKDTVYISAKAEISNGAYYSATDVATSYVGRMTHEALFLNDFVNGGVVPSLAEDAVDVNGDGLTWKITIKEGVMFHYGDKEYKEMKASDVKWTYEFTALEGEGGKSGVVVRTNTTMNLVDSIETTGDYEVVFKLKSPVFDFPNYCTWYILCEDAMNEYGHTDGQACGSGVYYINHDKSAAGQQWTLTRYDNYWNGIENHPTKNIVFVIHADENTGVAALQAGEVDLLTDISATNALLFQNNSDYNFYSAANTNLPTIFFNSYDGKGLFDGEDTEEQIKLRQAIKLALDKDKIVGVLYAVNPAAGSRLDSLWHPATNGFVDCGKSEFNLEKARALMNEIGYNDSNRLAVRLAHYSSYADYAQIVQTLLKEIYIDVECVVFDTSVFGATLRTGEGWDMAINYYAAKLTLAEVMTANLHSTGSNAKVYGWASAAMDEKIDNILAQTTAEAQLKAFQEFQEWANDYNPRIPTHTGNNMSVGCAELEGFAICPSTGLQDYTTIRIPE